MNNLLIAQSGGPTAAINATLSGILELAAVSNQIHKIYGAKNGIEGVLEEQFIELDSLVLDVNTLKKLSLTPGAALGSCRYKLKNDTESEDEYKQILQIFRKYQITYFIYIGGNDSMDTVLKLTNYCRKKAIRDLFIIGAPKTIDNDLAEIDHTPGFGSAAKYIATTFAELERDISVYESEAVTIVEVMGRNAGWLTAASILSKVNGNRGPDLIYLCERVFDCKRFLADVKAKLKEQKSILIAVSEGIKTEDNKYLGEHDLCGELGRVDMFGHKNIAGSGKYLEEMVKEEIGCKVRSIELNLMQRCAMHIASETDIMESSMLGMKALQSALEGRTGEMASLQRVEGLNYSVKYLTVPIESVANKEKAVPKEWINDEGNYVKQELFDYLFPLIQGEVNIAYNQGIPKQFIKKFA